MNFKRPFTKKEELRVLDKFIDTLHGESSIVTSKVMRNLLEIGYLRGLVELRKKYKERMKKDSF
jgi:hypothetical protein